MIVLTRLNGSRFAVNPDLVERIYETPDTTLVLANGSKYIVNEPMLEVIDLVAAYRARILRAAQDEIGEHSRRLSLVVDDDARPNPKTPGE